MKLKQHIEALFGSIATLMNAGYLNINDHSILLFWCWIIRHLTELGFITFKRNINYKYHSKAG